MPLPAIDKDDVLSALDFIDSHGVPPNRRSTKFCLVHKGRHYPPKYVYALAAANRTGKEPTPEEYSGGEQTNGPLRRLGFTIETCGKCHPDTPPKGKDKRPAIAQLIVRGRAPKTPASAREMLLEAFSHWPERFTADFLITPGGFVQGNLNSEVPTKKGWNSEQKDFPALRQVAERCLEEVLSVRLQAAAQGKARYLTIGVDLSNADGTFGAELVAVVDLNSGRILHWTGKSYPTSKEERYLWQFTDLESHCIHLAGYRVLVLGCHDLNMFSNRAWENMTEGSLRHERAAAMRMKAEAFRPQVILQHPHRTDSARIWGTAWGGAKELFKPLAWASGICYPAKDARQCLASVLKGTRSPDGPFCDIIFRPGHPPKVLSDDD